jgi:predicted transcriptional regulator
LNEYVQISPGARVFDIASTPGHVVRHLPVDVEYHGFDVAETLSNERSSLKRRALLFTLDGCFRAGQSRIARWIHANDRGKFVHTEDAYRSVLRQVFPDVRVHIREDRSFIPQTIIITVSRASDPHRCAYG